MKVLLYLAHTKLTVIRFISRNTLIVSQAMYRRNVTHVTLPHVTLRVCHFVHTRYVT